LINNECPEGHDKEEWDKKTKNTKRTIWENIHAQYLKNLEMTSNENEHDQLTDMNPNDLNPKDSTPASGSTSNNQTNGMNTISFNHDFIAMIQKQE
jgi:hypothetical protein